MLVAGPARSATSWVGEVLGATPGAMLVREPDNRALDPYAGLAKRGLGVYGFYPVVPRGGRAGEYATLWRLAFRGGWPRRGPLVAGRRAALAAMRRGHVLPMRAVARAAALVPPAAEHVVVKSVHCLLTLDWVAERTGARVVLVRRPVPDVVASWMERGWAPYPFETVPAIVDGWLRPLGLEPPPPGAGRVARMTWSVAVLDAVAADAARRHPEWTVADHPALCADPAGGLRRVVEAAGLSWSAAVEERVLASNRPGSGFETRRVAAEEPGKWRRRMSPEEAREMLETLDRLGIAVAGG